MHTLSPTDYTSNLRYALEVIDECEHLGLDDEYASKLRAILEHQIEDADEVASCYPAEPVRFRGPTE